MRGSPGRRVRRARFASRAPACAVVLALLLLPTTTPRAAAQQNDTLAAVQSNSGFNSLADGQPNAPGGFEIDVDVGTQDLVDSAMLQDFAIQPSYTPEGSWLLRNMQLGITAQVEVEEGDAFLSDIIPFWQQRWVADADAMLTVATQALLDIEPHDSNVVPSLIGVVVQTLGPVNVYLNGQLEWENGDELTQWTAIAGLSLNAAPGAPTVDLVHVEEDDAPVQNILELSAAFDIGDRLSIGPGLLIGLDPEPGTPRFGGGVHVSYDF